MGITAVRKSMKHTHIDACAHSSRSADLQLLELILIGLCMGSLCCAG